MRKKVTYSLAMIALLFSAIFFSSFDTNAQNRQQPKKSLMAFEIIEGDTLYYDVLNPSWIFPKGRKQKGKDWRKYYRLVHNFGKAYPYALAAKDLVAEVDSTIEVSHFNRIQKEKYIAEKQKQLFNSFEDKMKHMTISQGALLIKLIDREVGKAGYYIIKDYKSGITATFWQGVAKLFKNDLKSHYDPLGEDASTEHLIQIWELGLYPELYFSIFGKYPEVIDVSLNK